MSLGKIFFIHLLLVAVSADHVYLRCDAHPDHPSCSFSTSDAEDEDLQDNLGYVTYKPDAPSDVWILSFQPGTPENPKTTIEESFGFQRLDIHTVFDNTVNVVHDLGDCDTWMVGGQQLGVFASLDLLSFTQTSSGKSFSSYDPQAVVVCHNDASRVFKFKHIAAACPNSPVQRYSFRDGPLNVEAAAAEEEEEWGDDLPNGMGYLNIFYVKDCYPNGPDNAGGIYLIKNTDFHANSGHFLMTHTETAHHSIELLEGPHTTVYTSEGITSQDAIKLLVNIKVDADEDLPDQPVVTKLIMKRLVDGAAPEEEVVEFDPAIAHPQIRI